jgi:hypothetical protein
VVACAGAGGVLVERPSIEVLACGAHAERTSQWQQEVDASALQEVVRAHAVEGVEVTALVEERSERAIVPREDGFSAGYWLRALQGDVIRAVQIVDTEANALATAERISSEGPPPGAPVSLTSVTTYEAIAEA